LRGSSRPRRCGTRVTGIGLKRRDLITGGSTCLDCASPLHMIFRPQAQKAASAMQVMPLSKNVLSALSGHAPALRTSASRFVRFMVMVSSVRVAAT
jgi:hypothetical protein